MLLIMSLAPGYGLPWGYGRLIPVILSILTYTRENDFSHPTKKKISRQTSGVHCATGTLLRFVDFNAEKIAQISNGIQYSIDCKGTMSLTYVPCICPLHMSLTYTNQALPDFGSIHE